MLILTKRFKVLNSPEWERGKKREGAWASICWLENGERWGEIDQKWGRDGEKLSRSWGEREGRERRDGERVTKMPETREFRSQWEGLYVGQVLFHILSTRECHGVWHHRRMTI